MLTANLIGKRKMKSATASVEIGILFFIVTFFFTTVLAQYGGQFADIQVRLSQPTSSLVCLFYSENIVLWFPKWNLIYRMCVVFQGEYCSKRIGGCCEGRVDDCSTPILGTLCYCDKFCNRTDNPDCCPDYYSACLGMLLKPPEGIAVKPRKNLELTQFPFV